MASGVRRRARGAKRGAATRPRTLAVAPQRPADGPAGQGSRTVLLAALGVAALTFCTFSVALRNDFVNYDDRSNLLDNPMFRGFGWEQLRWMATTFHMGHWQPLSWLSFAVDHAVWGLDPMGYHLTSVLLHAANSVLLYFVLRAFLRLRSPAPAEWPAVIGALFHAIHPLRVESVAWVTERRDVLCGFFALLSLLAYLKRIEEERADRPAMKWLVLSCAAFGASLLSKALSIMLPVVLLILDAAVFGRLKPGARGRTLLEKVPYFLLAAADAAIMIVAMRHIDAVRPLATYNVAERAAQAAYGLCFYLLKSLWPVGLIPIYRVEVPLDPWRAKYVVAMLAVAAATAAFAHYRRRWPEGLAAWACYVALLLPVLGVAVTGGQVAADRYTYLAMIPAAVLVAAGLERGVAGASPRRRTVVVAAAGVLAIWSVLTIRQIGVWKDSITLWSHQLHYDPDSSLAYNSRGAARQDLGDAAGAIADCTRAIEIAPRSADPYLNRGLAEAQLGDLGAAIRDFNTLIELDPRNAKGYQNRGVARMQKNDLEGSFSDLSEALRLNGDRPAIHEARGIVHARRGNLKAAAEEFERALQSAPPDWPRRREVEALRKRALGN